jgi:hypothetical protein
VPEDSVRAVTGFLLDAARGEVSVNTVVQVLRHWADEGVTRDQLLHAAESACDSADATYSHSLTAYMRAIRSGL